MLSLPETIPQKGRYQGSRKSHYLNAWVSFTGVITVEFAIFISGLPQPVFPGRAAMAPSSLPCAQRGEMAQGNLPSHSRRDKWPQIPNRHHQFVNLLWFVPAGAAGLCSVALGRAKSWNFSDMGQEVTQHREKPTSRVLQAVQQRVGGSGVPWEGAAAGTPR